MVQSLFYAFLFLLKIPIFFYTHITNTLKTPVKATETKPEDPRLKPLISSHASCETSASSPSASPNSKSNPPLSPQFIVKDVRVYRHIEVIKTINKAKFQIYLVRSKINNEYFAMKVFPFVEDVPNPHFNNETRFIFMDHPNIIRNYHSEKERITICQGTTQKTSYIIMEYAPYGDLFDFIMRYREEIDDMLIRSYFRQLIEGLEYLHKNGISHMDLKLENLLLGKDFTLKIADFDLSCLNNDKKIMGRGTKSYSPQEVVQGRCHNTQAADIYSVGIILFALKTRGLLPYAEGKVICGVDFMVLMNNCNQKFWEKHCEIQNKEASFFEDEFKELFNSMISLNPSLRPSIQKIKESRWYNGPYYNSEEVKARVEKMYARRGISISEAPEMM